VTILIALFGCNVVVLWIYIFQKTVHNVYRVAYKILNIRSDVNYYYYYYYYYYYLPPFNRVFVTEYLKQPILLRYVILQLLCGYHIWYN